LKILITGGGSVTEELLKRINLKNNQVIVVEKDPDKCSQIGSKYDVLVVNKDATDISLYTSDISLSDLDAILALTDRDEVNILTLTIAKLYRVPFRIARVKSPKVAELITDLNLGIPITMPSVFADVVSGYLESVNEPKVLGRFGEFILYRITVNETDRAVNKKINELGLPEAVRVILMFDGSSLYFPNGEERLMPGHQLIVISPEGFDVVKAIKG